MGTIFKYQSFDAMTLCYMNMVSWVVLAFSAACGQIQITFFLFVIMNDLPKWGTDPNFSYSFTKFNSFLAEIFIFYPLKISESLSLCFFLCLSIPRSLSLSLFLSISLSLSLSLSPSLSLSLSLFLSLFLYRRQANVVPKTKLKLRPLY